MNLEADILPFDKVEIIRELEFGSEMYIPLKPLQKGSHVPDLAFTAIHNDGDLFINTNSTVTINQNTGSPLVLSFYAVEWKAYGLAHLEQMNILQKKISALGGDLLIVTPDGPESELREVIWDNNLKLNFYADTDHRIARQFGIYSELDPAWNKYPGIDVNVPLLATYVISNSKIVHNHIDTNLTGPAAAEDLLKAVSENYRSVGVRAA